MTLSDLTSIIAVIGSVIAVYLAYRKAPHEEGSLDADTVKTYQETANLAGERANELEKELATVKKKLREQQLLLDELTGRDANLQSRVAALENENCELQERVRMLEQENGDLREWAARLVTQVKNLGGTPVQLREKRAK